MIRIPIDNHTPELAHVESWPVSLLHVIRPTEPREHQVKMLLPIARELARQLGPLTAADGKTSEGLAYARANAELRRRDQGGRVVACECRNGGRGPSAYWQDADGGRGQLCCQCLGVRKEGVCG